VELGGLVSLVLNCKCVFERNTRLEVFDDLRRSESQCLPEELISRRQYKRKKCQLVKRDFHHCTVIV